MRGIFLIVTSLMFGLGGCKTMERAAQESKTLSYSSVAKLPEITCQKGELMYFHLEEQGLKPDSSKIRFTKASQEEEYTLVKPTSDFNIRLDVCVHAEDKLELKRIVYLPHPAKPAVALLPNRFSELRGIESAIFQDDHGDVDVEINFGAQEEGYLLKGWKQDQGFVTFSPMRKHADGQAVPTQAALLYGKIVYGNPW